MILRRSLHKELMVFVSAIYLALILVTLTFTLIRLLGQASNGKIDPQSVFILLGYSLVNYQAIIISFACFLGVLLTFTRLWRDSEMVVWFSSGASLWRFLSPVFRFALPLALLAAVFSMLVAPWANRQAQDYREAYEKRDDISRIAVGQFRESAGGTRIFYVESADEASGKVADVFIAQREANGKLNAAVIAEKGQTTQTPSGDKWLTLDNGRRYELRDKEADLRWLQFKQYEVALQQKRDDPNAQLAYKLRSTGSLFKEKSKPALAELFWRIAGPLNTLLLALLAVPLSYFNPRSGRAAPILIAILLFMINLNFATVAQNMVLSGKLRFEAALLVPSLLIVGATFLLMLRRTGQGWRYWFSKPYQTPAAQGAPHA